MNYSSQALLNDAIKAFQNGNFDRADSILKQIIRTDSKNLPALQILGLIQASKGNYQEAIHFLSKTVKIDPNNASIHYNLAKALMDSGDYHKSIPHHQKAADLTPHNPSIWLNYGKATTCIGEHELALTFFNKAFQLNPHHAETLSNKSSVLFELKRYAEALESVQQALELNPQLAEAWLLKGIVLKELKRYEESLTDFDKAFQLNPSYEKTLLNKSSTLFELNRYAEALECAQQAVELNLQLAEAWLLKGIVLKELKRYEEALTDFDKALILKKDYAEAHFNKGHALQELKRLSEAITQYHQAIKFKEGYAEAYSNLGSALYELKQYKEALEYFDKALSLLPDDAETYFNKACALYSLKQYSEALAAYDKAIELKPDHYDSLWNKSIYLLLHGDFDHGWKLYEARWKRKGADPIPHQTIPELRHLNQVGDKKVLVWHEQGFGDVIQFSRYVPMLIALGVNVTFQVQKPLVNLFKGQFSCVLTSDLSENEIFDFQVPLLSLPKLFNTTLDSIPSIPDIHISTEKINEWRARLHLSQTKINVGLAVSGNPKLKSFLDNLIPLSAFTPLLNKCKFFLIQKGMVESDYQFLHDHPEFTYLGADIEDFSDTAAIMNAMEIVISVDTAIIHLAGSLRKQSFLLLQEYPEWRWLMDRSDSPWYPSLQILRQKTLGNWNEVINCLNSKIGNPN